MTQPSRFLPFQVLLLCLTGMVGEIIVVEGIMVVEALMVAEAIMVEGATMVVGATIVAEVIRNPTIPSVKSETCYLPFWGPGQGWKGNWLLPGHNRTSRSKVRLICTEILESIANQVEGSV